MVYEEGIKLLVQLGALLLCQHSFFRNNSVNHGMLKFYKSLPCSLPAQLPTLYYQKKSMHGITLHECIGWKNTLPEADP